MTMLLTMECLLAEAEADGIDTSPDRCHFVVDGKAFWHEIELEGLKVSEPRKAYDRLIFLAEGLGRLELCCLDDLPEMPENRRVAVEDWHDELERETLKQSTWRQYKTLPAEMQDERWPSVINGAETLNAMTMTSWRIECLHRAARYRRAKASA